MKDGPHSDQKVIPTHPPQFGEVHRYGALNRRPKLLFLAWHFPPLSTTACVRTWNMAKYLGRLGWDITVVTPHPSIWRTVDSPEETDILLNRQGIRRILTGHQWRCLIPQYQNCNNEGPSWLIGGVCRRISRRLGIDRAIGWIKPAERACAALSPQDVDVILASGEPFIAFRLAKRLSEKLGCPYVLDYRDPWTGNPHSAHLPQPTAIQEEAKLLKDCAAVTIVSHSWGLGLDSRFGLGPKLHIITNGYDPEQLENIKPHDFGQFAIVYTGNFYPPKRVITPVMAALKRLKETMNGKDGQWNFHYYGENENHILEEAKRFGVMERIVLHGQVPRSEVLSAVRGAGVAVVITSVSEEATMGDRGIVTGKIFENIGLGIPILLIAPSGSDVNTIAETTGLARSFTGSDINGMASFLSDTKLGRPTRPKNLEIYAWTNIAKKLDAVLHGVVAMAICNKREVGI